MDLTGKYALVTGGASPLGAAIARRLAAGGARVAVHYCTSAARAEQVARECGGVALQADLAAPAGAAALATALHDRWPHLDALVNNAAVTTPYTWDATDPETWQRVLAAGLCGPFYTLRACQPLLAGQGSVVNIGSVAGLNGGVLGPAYGAAKAGLLGLTKAAARALGSQGIRVNAVCPGPVDSPLVDGLPPAAVAAMVATTPLGRLATGDDVAEAVCWLCSDAARFVTGQTLVVDGGRVMH